MLATLLRRWRDALAVDLGTANTRVGIVGRGLVLDEPSVVAVEQRSRRVLADGAAVGHLARQMQGRTPDAIQVLSPLREGVIADFELCEAMLREFFRRTRSSAWRLRPQVILSSPGGITPVEQRAAFNSVLRAGAGEAWMMPAPKAAAIAVGLPIVEPVASLICVVGAGSTEVAMLSLGDAVATESVRVGGESFDRALADYLRRKHNLRVSPAAAEKLRIEIGTAAKLDDELSAEISGVDAAAGLPRKATVTSEQARTALAEPLARVVDAVRVVIDRSTCELAADLVDQGMVLCGGAAQLRGLDRYLSEQLGVPVRVASDPATTVLRGLLVCLERLPQWRHMIKSSEENC